jgi:A/G-specific adenine glycosylase
MENWFSEGLLSWYSHNKRDLPWRNTKDPYHIWLSEIILQQTQVNQGLRYYLRFTSRFRTVSELADANEDEVLKLWQGLGYYSRARNLLFTAKVIRTDYGGNFPRNYKEILALKGIGDYTAAAIASFAFNLPHAVVDGNVYRVLSRLFGIDLPIDSGEGKKRFQELASQLLNKKDPAAHNQAIMEFGSQYCRVSNPDCNNCVFSDKCAALASARVSLLPVKAKKISIRERHFNYLLLIDEKKKIILNRRSKSDIWKGLYEFPLIESSAALNKKELMLHEEMKQFCEPEEAIQYVSEPYKHILSHQHLHARFYVIRTKKNLKGTASVISSVSGLDNFAFPRLIEKFLQDCDLKEII